MPWYHIYQGDESDAYELNVVSKNYVFCDKKLNQNTLLLTK